MGVEVAEHGVTFPATDDADLVRIHTDEEKGHCSTGAKGASCDIVWIDASIAGDGQGSSLQEACYH